MIVLSKEAATALRCVAGAKYMDVPGGIEKVESTLLYPAMYRHIPLEEQVATLRSIWPQLEVGTHVVRLERMAFGPLVSMAFVNWRALASDYTDAITRELFPALEFRFKRLSYHENDFPVAARHRLSERSREFYDRIAKSQTGDFHVVTSQFGFARRGESAEYTRSTYGASEFGHGVFAVGSMLLANPARLSKDSLTLECPGDECSGAVTHAFDRAPLFTMESDSLTYYTSWADVAVESSAQVSGTFK